MSSKVKIEAISLLYATSCVRDHPVPVAQSFHFFLNSRITHEVAHIGLLNCVNYYIRPPPEELFKMKSTPSFGCTTSEEPRLGWVLPVTPVTGLALWLLLFFIHRIHSWGNYIWFLSVISAPATQKGWMKRPNEVRVSSLFVNMLLFPLVTLPVVVSYLWWCCLCLVTWSSSI